ncbi:hypothetical protein GCM10009000_077410 [Halobacterium noricense]
MALLLFGFTDLCVNLEAGIVVIGEPRLPRFVRVGFTGERAVGQLTDRIVKVSLGAVEVGIDAAYSTSIKRRGMCDDTPDIMFRNGFLVGLNLVGGGVFVVFIVDKRSKMGSLVILPRAVDVVDFIF